jgi:hypothetical protein
MTQETLDRGQLDEQWAAFMQALVGKLQVRLYDLNAKEGLKQKDIAERLGHSDPTYLSRCLAGQRNMTLRTVHDLARAMNSRLEISLKPYEEMTPTNNRPKREEPKPAPASGNSGINFYKSDDRFVSASS